MASSVVKGAQQQLEKWTGNQIDQGQTLAAHHRHCGAQE